MVVTQHHVDAFELALTCTLHRPFLLSFLTRRFIGYQVWVTALIRMDLLSDR